MRVGWNPASRGRNLCIERRGFGCNDRWSSEALARLYASWEILQYKVAMPGKIGDCSLTFLGEPPPWASHRVGIRLDACAIGDICRVLASAAPDHLEGIDLVILRQPSRQEPILGPIGGRLAYAAPGLARGWLSIWRHRRASR